jgi:hypothetical protein
MIHHLSVKEAASWLGYTYLYVRMLRYVTCITIIDTIILTNYTYLIRRLYI